MNRAVSLACISGMSAIVFFACLYAKRYQPGGVLAAPLLDELPGGFRAKFWASGRPV